MSFLKEHQAIQHAVLVWWCCAVAKFSLLQVYGGRALTDDEITGLLIATLFAGQHTSSITSAWTGYLMIANKARSRSLAVQLSECARTPLLSHNGLRMCWERFLFSTDPTHPAHFPFQRPRHAVHDPGVRNAGSGVGRQQGPSAAHAGGFRPRNKDSAQGNISSLQRNIADALMCKWDNDQPHRGLLPCGAGGGMCGSGGACLGSAVPDEWKNALGDSDALQRSSTAALWPEHAVLGNLTARPSA